MSLDLMKARNRSRKPPPPWLVVAHYKDGTKRNFWRRNRVDAEAVRAWAMRLDTVTDAFVYDRRFREKDGPLY